MWFTVWTVWTCPHRRSRTGGQPAERGPLVSRFFFFLDFRDRCRVRVRPRVWTVHTLHTLTPIRPRQPESIVTHPHLELDMRMAWRPQPPLARLAVLCSCASPRLAPR